MLIRFIGPSCVRRIVGGVEFSAETGMVQNVDADLAEALVMTGEFDYVEDELPDMAENGFEVTGWVEEVADALEGEDAEGDWFLSEDPEAVEDGEAADEADNDAVGGGLTRRG